MRVPKLIKLAAAALCHHPRLNASWLDDQIWLNEEINVGLAVAVEEGLLVPVLHNADQLGLAQIAAQRAEVVEQALSSKLGLAAMQGGHLYHQQSGHVWHHQI